MGTIHFNGENLNDYVVISSNDAIKFLEAASSKLSSIKIPSDCPDAGIVRSAPNRILTIEGMVNSASQSIESSIERFKGAEISNALLARDLAFEAMRSGRITYAEYVELLNNVDDLKKLVQAILDKTHPGYGTGTTYEDGRSVYKGDTWLETGQNCWIRIFGNGYDIDYSLAGQTIPYDLSKPGWNPITDGRGKIDCSSFVCWVLYEYGYDTFQGNQLCTQDFIDQAKGRFGEDEVDWRTYGWTFKEANNGKEAKEIIQEGDIVVNYLVDGDLDDQHMFIVSEIKDDGTVITFDAGWSTHWREGGSEEGYSNLYFTEGTDQNNRKCVIITVEDVSYEETNQLNELQQEISIKEKKLEEGRRQTK